MTYLNDYVTIMLLLCYYYVTIMLLLYLFIYNDNALVSLTTYLIGIVSVRC